MTTTPKLPKAFKRKWVAALRSGKYEQAVELLKDGNAYCCLGVAGKISGTSDDALKEFTVLQPGMVPNEVLKVLNFERASATRQDILSHYNDKGWSFKRIATWIQRNL